MKAVLRTLGGLAGLVVGWAATAAAVIAFGENFGLSNFEGQRDMTAVFFFGPIGGLIGLVIGVAVARRRLSPRSRPPPTSARSRP